MCCWVVPLCYLSVVRPWMLRWLVLAFSRGSNLISLCRESCSISVNTLPTLTKFHTRAMWLAESCVLCQLSLQTAWRRTTTVSFMQPSRAQLSRLRPHQERSRRVTRVSGTGGAFRCCLLAASFVLLSIIHRSPQTAEGVRGQFQDGARTALRYSSIQECA